MSSLHEQLAAPAASILVEHFGERDGDGALMPHVIRLPSGVLILWPASVGELTSRLVEDEEKLISVETCVLLGRSEDFPPESLPLNRRTSVVVVKYGTLPFNLDHELTKYSGALVTLGLVRKPNQRLGNLAGPAPG